MKSIQVKFFGAALAAFAVVLHQSCTLADDYEYDEVEVSDVSTLRSLKELTPEEEALANEARAHIAKAIEDNLVRLLAIASARGDRRPRQEDEDDDPVTPNPNVLPQVAQILGAIFSGGLNISRVVDRTFGLVPNIVRNQVGGIVKLLTGENMEDGKSSTVTSAVVTSTAAGAGPAAPIVITEPATVVPAVTAAPAVQAANEAVIVEAPTAEISKLSVEPEVETTTLGKYRIRNRTKGPSTTTVRPLEDDEIEKLSDDVRRAARAYEPPTGREKDPRVLAEIFRNVISRIDFNSTEIARAVPSIFKGARQAMVVLENLGIIDVNDVLDELDLPPLEEEEEE